MSWTDLVMWDNMSFYYHCNSDISTPNKEKYLLQIKKILNNYLNNLAYDGYIKKNMINIHPEINLNKNEIDYNISIYPLTSPRNFPQYIFNLLPNEIQLSNKIILTKKNFHAI